MIFWPDYFMYVDYYWTESVWKQYGKIFTIKGFQNAMIGFNFALLFTDPLCRVSHLPLFVSVTPSFGPSAPFICHSFKVSLLGYEPSTSPFNASSIMGPECYELRYCGMWGGAEVLHWKLSVQQAGARQETWDFPTRGFPHTCTRGWARPFSGKASQ